MVCEMYLNTSVKKREKICIYDILEGATFKLRADPKEVEATRAISSHQNGLLKLHSPKQ